MINQDYIKDCLETKSRINNFYEFASDDHKNYCKTDSSQNSTASRVVKYIKVNQNVRPSTHQELNKLNFDVSSQLNNIYNNTCNKQKSNIVSNIRPALKIEIVQNKKLLNLQQKQFILNKNFVFRSSSQTKNYQTCQSANSTNSITYKNSPGGQFQQLIINNQQLESCPILQLNHIQNQNDFLQDLQTQKLNKNILQKQNLVSREQKEYNFQLRNIVEKIQSPCSINSAVGREKQDDQKNNQSQQISNAQSKKATKPPNQKKSIKSKKMMQFESLSQKKYQQKNTQGKITSKNAFNQNSSYKKLLNDIQKTYYNNQHDSNKKQQANQYEQNYINQEDSQQNMEFGITSFSENQIIQKNKSAQNSIDAKKRCEKENDVHLTPTDNQLILIQQNYQTVKQFSNTISNSNKQNRYEQNKIRSIQFSGCSSANSKIIRNNFSINSNFELVKNQINIQQQEQEDLELSASEQLEQESIQIENDSNHQIEIINDSLDDPDIQSYIISDKCIPHIKKEAQTQKQSSFKLHLQEKITHLSIQDFNQRFEDINLRIKNTCQKNQNEQQILYFNKISQDNQSSKQQTISANINKQSTNKKGEEESIYLKLDHSNKKQSNIKENEIYSPTKIYRKSKSTSILFGDSLNLDTSLDNQQKNQTLKSQKQKNFEKLLQQIQIQNNKADQIDNNQSIIDEFEINQQKNRQLNSKKQLKQKKSLDCININEFKGALNYTQISDYRLGQMLGQGAYAIVREAIHVGTGFRVAIKIYDKFKLNQNSLIKKSVLREINILSKLTKCINSHQQLQDEQILNQDLKFSSHPSIMKLYDAIDTQRQLFLVLENCQGKMLSQVMKEESKKSVLSTKNNLPEEICSRILYQLLLAINFCHKMNIAHRDIKLENILVDINTSDVETKLIDFGFATQTSDDQKLTAVCGTPAFMAPELCGKKSYKGSETDMWSLGIVFYTILFGKQPFQAKSEADLFQKIIQGNLSFPQSSHPDFDKDLNNSLIKQSDQNSFQKQTLDQHENYKQQIKKSNIRPQNPLTQKHKDQKLTIHSPISKKTKYSHQKQKINDFSNKALRNIIEKRVDSQKKQIPQKSNETIEKVEHPTQIHYTKQAKRIVQDLLQVDCLKRLSAEQVLSKYDQWFVKHMNK